MRGGFSVRAVRVVSRATCQGDAAPLRYQRRSSIIAVHRDPKATAGTVLGVQHGTVAPVDLSDPDPVLPGQGLVSDRS